MSIPNGITPIPIVSGLALLQLGSAGDDWTGYVGLFSVVAVAVVVVLSKLGLLKTVGGNERSAAEKERDQQLSRSLDELGRKVQQLDATITSQVRIMGSFTEEIRAATRQASATHNYLKLQEELQRERRLRRGEVG